jgi:hypothetical protein
MDGRLQRLRETVASMRINPLVKFRCVSCISRVGWLFFQS